MSHFIETINVEPCRPRAGEAPGWIYFIACTETKRLKIGFTNSSVEKRMRGLQTGAAGELRLIAKHPGTRDSERNLHARFGDQRLHGEWFEMCEELFAYLAATVWLMAAVYMKNGWEPDPWLVSGLRMIRDANDDKPLPPGFEAMIA